MTQRDEIVKLMAGAMEECLPSRMSYDPNDPTAIKWAIAISEESSQAALSAFMASDVMKEVRKSINALLDDFTEQGDYEDYERLHSVILARKTLAALEELGK